ncbi:hypothetical protein EON65_10045 [archaeon]|nr:MAG: hypothetical protein EON65_10045 [archaeon]
MSRRRRQQVEEEEEEEEEWESADEAAEADGQDNDKATNEPAITTKKSDENAPEVKGNASKAEGLAKVETTDVEGQSAEKGPGHKKDKPEKTSRDPAAVPRKGQFFLHDDRGGGSSR